jgi:NADH-quinone oxidoreductase subunit M
LLTLGLLNLIYGAVAALAQTDIRRVLGYASISQLGMVLLGVASLNELGLMGALFHLVSIGLVFPLLILIAGSLYERTGSAELPELGGLAGPMPYMSGLFMAAGLAALGMPGLSGFTGTFTILLGLFDTMKAAAVAGALALLLGLAYMLRAVLGITFGPIQDAHASLKDARLIEAVPMIILIAFIILLGIYPSIMLDQIAHGFSSLLRSLDSRIGG